jgi:hypothetical protein
MPPLTHHLPVYNRVSSLFSFCVYPVGNKNRLFLWPLWPSLFDIDSIQEEISVFILQRSCDRTPLLNHSTP